MNSTMRLSVFALSALPVLGASGVSSAQQANMSFFVTSVGSAKGADLGGLAGADRICQQLAQAVGAGDRAWHAYLSAQTADGQLAVNARDRIGHGPWQNAKGAIVAKDVEELHGDNNLTKQTALTEKGDVVNGRGDTPNRHDALTGSQPTAEPFRRVTIRPATTGRAAPKGPRCSGTSTGRACATMPNRSRGTLRTCPAGRTAVAARRICAAPAATAYSIVSPPIRVRALDFRCRSAAKCRFNAQDSAAGQRRPPPPTN
jgi:hypothetical protein